MCKPRTKDATDVAVYSPYDVVAQQEDALTEQMEEFYRSVQWDYIDGEVVIDRKKERERLYTILLLFLVSMHGSGYQDGTERLRRLVPAVPPVPTPIPAESPAFIFAKEEAARASRSILDTIHDEMKAAASRATEEGLPPAGVKAAVGAKLEELTEVGPERVSSTETVRGFTAGQTRVADDFNSGVLKPVAAPADEDAPPQGEVDLAIKIMWVTEDDAKVCPFCRVMHGEAIVPGDTFFKKGETMYVERGRPGHFSATPDGELGPDVSRLVFDYDDISGPPLHVLCRCYIEFVLVREPDK